MRGRIEQMERSALSGASTDVAVSMSHKPAGSASIHTNQTRNPPSTEPQLFPEPPTMTITQIRKVNRNG